MKMRALPYAASLVTTPIIIAACLSAMLVICSSPDQFSWGFLGLGFAGLDAGEGRHYYSANDSSTANGMRLLPSQPAAEATAAIVGAATAASSGSSRTIDAVSASGDQLSSASAAAAAAATTRLVAAHDATMHKAAAIQATEAAAGSAVIQRTSASCFSKQSEGEIRATMAAGWSATTAPQFGYVDVGPEEELLVVPLDARTCFTITGMLSATERHGACYKIPSATKLCLATSQGVLQCRRFYPYVQSLRGVRNALR